MDRHFKTDHENRVAHTVTISQQMKKKMQGDKKSGTVQITD